MRSSPKPVRKCHRCPLNLGKRCGVFASPHDQWDKRKCPGFMNDKLLARDQQDIESHPEDESKLARQQHAKEARSTPHWQGDRHLFMQSER